MKRFEMYQDRIARFNGNLPISISFQVTEDCNLACTYCYQTNKAKTAMSFDVARKFVDCILDNNKGFEKYSDIEKCGGYIFDFIGGEPFLQVEVIDQICQYILKCMIEMQHPLLPFVRFSFSSNGILYFDPKVQAFLKKFKDFISLSISIDGNKALHDSCRVFSNGAGSYDIAMKGVIDWVKRGNYMGSKMTLCPQNIDKTASAVISLIENGYEDIHLNCVYEEGWELKHATTLYLEQKRLADYVIDNEPDVTISMFNDRNFKPLTDNYNENWCGGNGRMIAVDPRGDIFPCIRYMKSSLGNSQEPLCIGNVDQGILQSEKTCGINDCLKCVTRKSQSTQECIDCQIASGCAWCTAYNYQITGTPNKRLTYICEMHKATSLANVYYWNKLYKKNGEVDENGKTRVFKMYLQKEDAVKIVGEEEYYLLKELER